jgi:hypothetical protein
MPQTVNTDEDQADQKLVSCIHIGIVAEAILIRKIYRIATDCRHLVPQSTALV